MICTECGHEMEYREDLEYSHMIDGHVFSVLGVPGHKCPYCGEEEYSQAVAHKLIKMTDEFREKLRKISRVKYDAA